MKSHISSAAILTSCALILWSCEKELDIDYHKIEPMPVIEATLDLEGATVAITLTTPMDEPMDTILQTNASVMLTDITLGRTETLAPDDKGLFRSATPGVTGHSYRLDVDLDGDRFSTRGVMADTVKITDIAMEWIKMPYDRVAILKVDFTDSDPTPGNSYWLRIYRNGKPYRWSVGDDRAASPDGTISAIQMTTRRDTTAEDEDDLLVDGDVIRATVAQIDTPMYRMLEALTGSGSNGPQLWAGPKRCLGYFLASPVADTTIVFRPDSIPG